MARFDGFPRRPRGKKKSLRIVAPRVSAHPSVCGGKPVVAGTRIPVDMLVVEVAQGSTIEDVARGYGIKKKDVQAALIYAAKVASATKATPASKSRAKA